MQIHELNNFTGTLGSGAYLAIDDGNDTGKISSQGLLAATEARIDNIIAGPAPSAEEIVDARLGADGVTYPSLGDAIRDQFTDVKSEINEIAHFPTNLFNASDATDGYRIDSQGTNYIDAGYFVSDFIEVTAGNIYIKNSPQEDSYHRWGIYNASKACITVGTTNTIQTTDATKYVKICGALAEKNTTTLYDSEDSQSTAVDRVARDEIDNYYKQWQTEDYTRVVTKAASFQQLESNITYYAQAGFRCVKYSIPSGATKLKCDCASLNVLSGYSGGAFYDSSGNHVSRFANYNEGGGQPTVFTNLEVDIPSNASVCYINQSSEIWNAPKFFSNADLSEDIDNIKDFIWGSNADIIFWGDSLTAGYGGNGVTFPAVCAANLGLSHLNCGVGGETANTISARQGGNNIVIPAGDINDTYSSLSDLFGGVVAPLLQGDGAGSGSKLYINGEECSLSSNGSTWTISGYTGGSSDIPVLGMFAGTNFGGKITVIFVGQNGSTFGDLTDVDARIAIIDSMIAHLHNTQYVVLGLSSGSDATRNAEDAKLLAHYGNKFFPTRKQVSQYGMTIEGLTPTAEDETRITEGKIPLALLLTDGIHMNAYGYDALGKLVADKIRSLGYV